MKEPQQNNLASLQLDLRNFLGERALLIESLTRVFRDGKPAKTGGPPGGIGLQPRPVTEYLAAVAISDAARKAIVILGSWPVLAGQSLMIFSGT
jgi:hypothetical protein